MQRVMNVQGTGNEGKVAKKGAELLPRGLTSDERPY